MHTEPATAAPPYASTRRWPRFKINVPIRAISQRYGRVLIVEGRGTELNEGGMLIFAGLELRVGEAADVEFTPPYQGTPIRARVIVRNRRGYYYGIEFLQETAEDNQRVSRIRQTLQALGAPLQ